MPWREHAKAWLRLQLRWWKVKIKISTYQAVFVNLFLRPQLRHVASSLLVVLAARLHSLLHFLCAFERDGGETGDVIARVGRAHDELAGGGER